MCPTSIRHQNRDINFYKTTMNVFILKTQFVRSQAKRAIEEAPDGYRVEIREPNRNLDQNDKLQALCREASATRVWAGLKLDVDEWRHLFMAAWMRANKMQFRMLPAIDGHGMDIIYHRTSKLSVSQMSDLISYIEAWLYAPEAA